MLTLLLWRVRVSSFIREESVMGLASVIMVLVTGCGTFVAGFDSMSLMLIFVLSYPEMAH